MRARLNLAGLVLLAGILAGGPAHANEKAEPDPAGSQHWGAVRKLMFGDREILDGKDVIRVYLALRRRAGDTVIVPYRWATLSSAAAGAALGARILAWLADPNATYDLTSVLLGGKTIIGGLVGGLIAVELVKLAMGIRRSTGDLYAPALAVAITVGRVGCLLTGIADDTSGTPTSLPWGMDLGDGIRRHPTQLYETVSMVLVMVFLLAYYPFRRHDGQLMVVLMVLYAFHRFVNESLRIEPAVGLGLTLSQWGSVIILAAALGIEVYLRRVQPSRWATPKPA